MYVNDAIRNNAELSSTLKHFLLTLASYADHDGVCFPSQQTLAQAMSMGVRTVQRCVREAVELQLLSVRRRWRKSNVYRMLCLKPVKLSTMPPNNGGTEQPPSFENNVSNAVDKSPPKRWVSPREVALLLDDIGEVMGPNLVEKNRGFFFKIIRSTTYELFQDCLARVRQSILEAECTGDSIRNPSGLFTWMLRQAGAPI